MHSSRASSMDAPTSASLGAMGPLLQEIYSFVASENSLRGKVKDEQDSLVKYVEMIIEWLAHLAEAEEPPLSAKSWMKEARDLSYDMYDYIHKVNHFGAEASGRRGLWLKRRRSPMVTKIMEFRARAEEAYKNYERYKLGSLTFECRLFVSDKSRREVPHAEAKLGEHSPLNVLVKLAADDGDKQLKVLSISGPGGVGKTTVAQRLYQKIKGRFTYRASVRVSSYPDMRRLLTSIFFQIQKQQPQTDWDTHGLIENIKGRLQDKRYLIIIDDLWDASIWDIVRRAFPSGSYCSRIVVTTRLEDVALACCNYHSNNISEMTPLNVEQSRDLFLGRVFGCEDNNCPKEFKEVSYEIIRECGGLPLSIVIIANLLAYEPDLRREHWNHIYHSLCSSSRINTSYLPEHMKNVLNLVYNNLPSHLKTCLLYLIMYPADYKIQKDDLVRQWIAEGFLSGAERQRIQEVAGGYFDELVSRGMIQPVDTNCNGQVLSCTVHEMVLELAASKSMKDNFITILNYFQTSPGQLEMVRRLSVQFGGMKSASVPADYRLSQVRSLMFFGFFKCVPSIVKFRLLRVLILHIWADEDETSFDLTGICQLVLLRYLKIVCNITVKLPEEIKGLKFLETMQVDARVEAVPLDIFQLPCLLHLRLPGGSALPKIIGSALLTLGYFDLSSNSKDNVQNLGQLVDLRDLYLTCSTEQLDSLCVNMEALGSILGSLGNLRSVTLEPDSAPGSNSEARDSSTSISCDHLISDSCPPTLERLEFSPRICIFSSLPKWIEKLGKLCILKIVVRELGKHDINVLKSLDSLAALSLYVCTDPEERIVFDGGFPVLKHFKLVCSSFFPVFENGAMPNVRRLKLGFNANRIGQYSVVDAGLQNLSALEEISAEIGGDRANESDRIAAQSELENASSKHRNTPFVNVRLVDWTFKEKERTNTQAENRETYMDQQVAPSPQAGKPASVKAYYHKEAPLAANTIVSVLLDVSSSSSTAGRAALDLVVVLDVSASMSEFSRLDKLKSAMQFVIKKLSPRDRLSVVTFNDSASKLCPLRAMSEEAAMSDLKGILNGLVAEGGTNIEAGLRSGLQVLDGRPYTGGRTAGVLLMSGGRQTDGDATKVGNPRNYPVYTLSFGSYDSDVELLQKLASGGGTYNPVLDEGGMSMLDVCSQLIAGLLTVVVQDLHLIVSKPTTPAHDLDKIENLDPGDFIQETDGQSGAVTVKFGDLFSREVRKVVVKLLLKENTDDGCDVEILKVELSYPNGEGTNRERLPAQTLLVKRSKSASSGETTPELLAELLRRDQASSILLARALAYEWGRQEEAGEELFNAQRRMEDILEATNPMVAMLRTELQQLLELMEPRRGALLSRARRGALLSPYTARRSPAATQRAAPLNETGPEFFMKRRQYAHQYALAAELSHARQRFAARGVEGVRLFATPRMDAYLEQAKKFAEDPDAPLPTADVDVDEEIKKAKETALKNQEPNKIEDPTRPEVPSTSGKIGTRLFQRLGIANNP